MNSPKRVVFINLRMNNGEKIKVENEIGKLYQAIHYKEIQQ